jgi:hypothetical protein
MSDRHQRSWPSNVGSGSRPGLHIDRSKRTEDMDRPSTVVVSTPSPKLLVHLLSSGRESTSTNVWIDGVGNVQYVVVNN